MSRLYPQCHECHQLIYSGGRTYEVAKSGTTDGGAFYHSELRFECDNCMGRVAEKEEGER